MNKLPEETEVGGSDRVVHRDLGRAIERTLGRFSSVVRADSMDDAVMFVAAQEWSGLASALRDAGFESLVDLCVVDYQAFPAGTRPGSRFEVVINLLSYSLNERIRIRIPLAEGATCPTTCPTWPGADWFEREAFDMFGIVFEGHPELTRILMPDDWEGHPLRRDAATGAIPVQFSEAPKPQ